MLARQSDRLTEELLKIDTALRRHPETDLEKLGRLRPVCRQRISHLPPALDSRQPKPR